MRKLYQKALTAYAQGKIDQAISQLQRCIALNNCDIDTFKTLGVCLYDSKKYLLASDAFYKACMLDPKNEESWFNHAVCNTKLNDYEEAISSFIKCIECNSTHLNALIGLADAYRETNQSEQAISTYLAALNICGLDNKKLIFKMSQSLLVSGFWQEGFELFECRTFLDKAKRDHEHIQKWSGESINKKNILIECEQGFGDSIQFSRYLHILHNAGAHITLACPMPLMELFRESYPFINILPPGAQVSASEIDYYIPLMSLAGLHKTTINSVPFRHKYLKIPLQYQEKWAWIGNHDGVKIGLAWSGNPEHSNDKNRSIEPCQLLATLPKGPKYFSIQKSNTFLEASTFSDVVQLSAHIENFADTAAICSHMDVVITVDTSLAHLSGALGVNTWIMLPYCPDWRWLLDRDNSVWYENVKLIRQPSINNWKEVLELVRERINSLIA